MRDVLGWRCKFGVLGPSTNTIVQPDFEMMRPPGVTNHYSRIFTPNAQAVSNETFMAGTQIIGENTLDAVRSVMTCSPDYLVMGMSAVTFYGGVRGADEFQARVEKAAGIRISIGSHSCTAALKTYGGIRRIAVLSPYYPVANEQVARYFSDCGFAVVRDVHLECKSWTAIAEVPPGVLREKLIALNGSDVDAIVQVGTNLSMVRLAAAAETWLGKPVIAINTATYWHALRQNKIMDKMSEARAPARAILNFSSESMAFENSAVMVRRHINKPHKIEAGGLNSFDGRIGRHSQLGSRPSRFSQDRGLLARARMPVYYREAAARLEHVASRAREAELVGNTVKDICKEDKINGLTNLLAKLVRIAGDKCAVRQPIFRKASPRLFNQVVVNIHANNTARELCNRQREPAVA